MKKELTPTTTKNYLALKWWRELLWADCDRLTRKHFPDSGLLDDDQIETIYDIEMGKPTTTKGELLQDGNWLQKMEDKARDYPRLEQENKKLLDSNRELLECLQNVMNFPDLIAPGKFAYSIGEKYSLANSLKRPYKLYKELVTAINNAKNIQP